MAMLVYRSVNICTYIYNSCHLCLWPFQNGEVFYRAYDPYTSDDIHLRQSALLYMVKDQVEFSVERIFRLSAEAHLANVAAHRRMRMNDFQIRFAKDPWISHLPQVSSMPSISKNFEAAYQSFAWTWHGKKSRFCFGAPFSTIPTSAGLLPQVWWAEAWWLLRSALGLLRFRKAGKANLGVYGQKEVKQQTCFILCIDVHRISWYIMGVWMPLRHGMFGLLDCYSMPVCMNSLCECKWIEWVLTGCVMEMLSSQKNQGSSPNVFSCGGIRLRHK